MILLGKLVLIIMDWCKKLKKWTSLPKIKIYHSVQVDGLNMELLIINTIENGYNPHIRRTLMNFDQLQK
jgi:hypothetical protein